MTTESPDLSEVVAVFHHDGTNYEIDHLGIGAPDSQWGEFAIYADNVMVGEFAIPESILQPEHRPQRLPVTAAELISLALQTLTENGAS